MNSVIINLEALYDNVATINGWMSQHGAKWTVVTKVCCGHQNTLRALNMLNIHSIGDSRLENLEIARQTNADFETWYLRMPDISSVDNVVALSNVSLNSEIAVIQALNEAAAKRKVKHYIIIMIELGDLREGILPGSLVKFYKEVFELSHIGVVGIGANLGCLSGSVPAVDQFTQLVLYRELLELKFGQKLPLISAGTSSSLPMVLNRKMPRSINHFRIGESIFLGTNLIDGGTLPMLRDDTVMLEAEIVEIKEKSLVPLVETGAATPFHIDREDETTPGQRGYRALIGVGQLDTDVNGLRPVNSDYQIAGASSDLTVVNIGDAPDGLTVGDSMRFYLDYAAMVRLMGGKYIDKVVSPDLDVFNARQNGRIETTRIPPALQSA